MNTLRIKPLTLALMASFAVAQTALAGVEPRLHEDVSVTPGRIITPADEEVLSNSAAKVLRHIALARDALRKQDGEVAKREIKQAETLLDIIQSSVPTTIVKSRVWTTNNKLKYENSEEVPASFVPVYASLDERVDFDSVKMKGSAQQGAKENTKPASAKEDEAKDAAVYYEELDLPLNATRHFIAVAQSELAKKHFDKADQALRAALDNVDYIAVYLPAPLLAARINLERAEAHYSAGQTERAQVDVDRAIKQLTEAQKQADPNSQADVKEMLTQAQSLRDRLGKNEQGLSSEIKSLWRRAQTHADRAMAYTKFGWAKLRQHDPLRGDLIEAKRYVAYADIDANVLGDSNKAMHDLQQARIWLDKAAETIAKSSNLQDKAVYVKDIRAVVDSLLAGKAKPDKGEMANLTQQLTQAIGRF